MAQSLPILRSDSRSVRLPFRFVQPKNIRRRRQAFVRALRTTAPALIVLTLTSAAHAQGQMDFSGATTLMNTFKTFAIYAGAVICFAGLIFAGIRMLSGRFSEAIPGLFGALFGAGVLGWGAGWIGSLTGQTLQ